MPFKKLNKKKFFKSKSFTLIELLVVISIIGFLATLAISSLGRAREDAQIAAAALQQKELITAVVLYFKDVGFYPPDVNRGWDPGFMQTQPWNPDEGTDNPPTGGYASPGTNCSHCPSNWQQLLTANWNGPYLSAWPRFTPWKGKYDYNYWGDGTSRYGCSLSPGIYVGVQGDYDNDHTIPQSSEQKMIDKRLEFEACLNGESQMLLFGL